MERISIDINDFIARSHYLWLKQWLLLTSGDFKKNDFNCMTVAWGSIGAMWSTPFVQVVVRPSRYTHRFMEKYSTFTLAAFSEKHRADLQLLGSRSGRDGDKLSLTSLTPIASETIEAPGYAEAELIIECRKIYTDVFKPQNFLNATIDGRYPDKDYHTVYFGRIERISGTELYRFSKDK